MNKSRAFLSAIALASATLISQTALAGPISSTTTEITFVDNKATLQEVLTGGNAGTTFTNRYQFTLAQAGDFNADLSLQNEKSKSLSITGFTLYDQQGKIVEGTAAAGGGWMIDYDNLTAGKYTLEVAGGLATNAAGKYYASLSFGPSAIDVAIPEPAPLGLMFAGLGALGFTASRRKAAAKA